MKQSNWQLATGNWPKSKPGFNRKGREEKIAKSAESAKKSKLKNHLTAEARRAKKI